jgi:hypothetical protein
MKPKALIVLRALYVGLPVILKASWGEIEVFLGEDENGDMRLATEARCFKLGGGQVKGLPKYIALDMSLYGFLKACEQMTDDQIAVLAANIALNEMKRGESRESDRTDDPGAESVAVAQVATEDRGGSGDL